MMDTLGNALARMIDFSIPSVNALCGLFIVAVLVHQLMCCAGKYTRFERVGMGAIASGIVMATPATWIPNTPFQDWSFNIGRIGFTIYICAGGFQRDRHSIRNYIARSRAAQYLAGKGRMP